MNAMPAGSPMHNLAAAVGPTLTFAALSAIPAGTVFQGVCAACAMVTAGVAVQRFRWDAADRKRKLAALDAPKAPK